MSQRHKVIWFEGMNLDPHHFQQWDRYYKEVLNDRFRSIAHFDWGFLDVVVDKEALVNGQVSLLRCKGITPDGLAFNIPDEDPVPKSRSIQDFFPATETALSVYLSIPVERERGCNCQLDQESIKRETRYIFDNLSVTDDNTGTDEREVGIGRTNFQLRLEGESLEDFSALKIAEVIRSQDGSFVMSDRFIPPSLSVGASVNLMSITRRLLELLTAKSSSLRTGKPAKGQAQFTFLDLTIFEALQILNTYIPVLNHYHKIAKCHPEEFYIMLLTLAGRLTAFSEGEDINPGAFPLYDHNDLTKCFNQLDAKIRFLLDSIVVSESYVSIPLEKKSDSLYIGKVTDARLFKEAKFYLIASGDFPEKKIIAEVPTHLRVASPDTIDAVLSSFRTALPIKHISVPPMGLPAQAGRYYFQLESSGPFWEAISRSSSFAVFIPREFSGIVLEAVAV